ncbi:uncharacterized protein E0L32_000692 [Thyridium curvatum]|uniref:Intradiol ring-cleavage dioxygenases domain-containing protein n=1 Tax=Thyridium curvatum TaxID=1093900 RepID=A0A507ANU4_9PEZI|nr:uncharacterized protein E0L32_000692 [Thyridium curvatum]TPX12515.1 hypothetical protein E0L32_000692 [Thyridium curvatum]
MSLAKSNVPFKATDKEHSTPHPRMFAAVAALTSLIHAHPGEEHDATEVVKEATLRHTIADINSYAVGQCVNDVETLDRKQRAMERRMDTFRNLQANRGIVNDQQIYRRNNVQFAKWGQVSHDRTGKVDFTKSTPHVEVFGANTTCIMTPDNIIGPYYVLGEQIRSNVVEGHRGVPVHLEIQFVDVQDCKPVSGLLVDIWQCNATGVYSGVSAAGQGGLKSTFLRGVQQTDKDGVVEFDTIFPGHYQGRATHIHVSAHTGSSILPNNTFTGGDVNHISQLFFDQALISAVEKLAPYNTNRIPLTTNARDLYSGYAATEAYDPFPEYVFLDGKDLSQGLFMWIEVAINTKANYNDYAIVAAILGPEGGKNNPKYSLIKAITPPPTHG